jgi:hypothetical protein
MHRIEPSAISKAATFHRTDELVSILCVPAFKKTGGKALAQPPPCPWVVLKVLQSYETRLLQELGHFLLHLVSLR